MKSVFGVRSGRQLAAAASPVEGATPVAQARSSSIKAAIAGRQPPQKPPA
jgi:hypothetical protein